jgi:hypothetical protein
MQADERPPVDAIADEEAPDTFRPATVPPPAPSAPSTGKPPLFRGGVRTAAAFFLGISAGLIAPSTVNVVQGFMQQHLQTARGGIVAPALGPTEPTERADAKLDRKGRTPIAGGLMAIPPDFQSADGQFDVVLHFHGNTDLVENSFAVAHVNAPVVIMNLGLGSGPYEERFSSPDLFREVLSRVGSALERRGLVQPKLRRIALTSWSAGYGAIVRILENPSIGDTIDSVILLDGIHAAYLNNSKDVDPLRMGPYEKFARQAVRGDKLFVITHSDIEPYTYAGSKATTGALLDLM